MTRKRGKKRASGRGRRMRGSGEFRVTGQTLSWNVQQTTSGTGGFSANESKAGASAANAVVINPFGVGGRLYYFASLFDEWKLNSCRFVYEPFIGPTGSIETPSGAQNSGGLFERVMAMTLVGDSATSENTFNAIISAGGVVFRACERKSLPTKGLQVSKWLYTSTSTNSAITSMDYRQTSVGNLLIAFRDTSATNNTTYGGIRVEWDVSFRSPLPFGNPLGVPAPLPSLGGALSSTTPDVDSKDSCDKSRGRTIVDDSSHVLILRAEDLVEEYKVGETIPRELVVKAVSASTRDAKVRFDGALSATSAAGAPGTPSMALRAPSSGMPPSSRP